MAMSAISSHSLVSSKTMGQEGDGLEGIELGTFCVLGRRDNRYTTETSLHVRKVRQIELGTFCVLGRRDNRYTTETSLVSVKVIQYN
ncbi:hypothetical protein J6590_026249 [Homalodisca vitripennis]|nr:hypothetical protein J6590_026249 [Homalodisca vitripennis]